MALFCYILEFGSHSYKHWTSSLTFYKHWNSYLILPNVGILAPFYKHWNSHWIHSYFGILALFFADWNFQLILPSIWILALFLQTLEFLSYSFTANIKILVLSFQTMEFWPNIYKHWFSDLNLQNIGILALISISIGITILCFQRMEFLYCPSKDLNFGPIFYTLTFLSHRSKCWNSGSL